MRFWKQTALLVVFASLCLGAARHARADEEMPFTETFRLEACKLRARGYNEFFPLMPGYNLMLQGHEDSETITVLITVLRRTKVVDGVRCAVVREMEWEGDELVETSWNYFAICRKCKCVFYFGEDVDIYEDGEVSHEGAWLAGVNGAKAGMMMPGFPLVGSRYYQEMAPDVAMDRAEHLSVTAAVETPAGDFESCVEVVDTTPLEPEVEDVKIYAPGIGLVQDEELQLIYYGFGLGMPDLPDEDGDDDDDDDDE